MNRLGDAPTDVLFGLIALHNDLIAPTVISDAFRALAREGGRTLAEHLVAHGALTKAQRALVESLSCEYMARHGGDLQKSVASLIDAPSARARPDQLGEPELANTMAPAGTHAATPHRGEPLVHEPAAPVSQGGQRFQIVRRHAKGGLGEVFVALDRELNREVALKQLQDRCAADPATRRRFVAEAEITGGLEHPGIVPVYGLLWANTVKRSWSTGAWPSPWGGSSRASTGARRSSSFPRQADQPRRFPAAPWALRRT
jgi:hypothetical protein